MPKRTGPEPFYPLETVLRCIVDEPSLDLPGYLAVLDDDYYDERRWQMSEFCIPMLLAVQHPSDHFSQLDGHFSTLLPNTLKCHPTRPPSPPALGGHRRWDSPKLLEETENIISRLPRVPQQLFQLPFTGSGSWSRNPTLSEGIKDGKWASKYVLPEKRSLFQLDPDGGDDSNALFNLIMTLMRHAWNSLFVTVYIDTNSVVLARMIADRGNRSDISFAHSFLRYVNVLAELIDVYDSIKTEADIGFDDLYTDPSPSVQALKSALFPAVDDEHKHGRAVLKVFLWSAWQRSIMLYLFYIIGVQLSQGYSSEWNALLAVRGITQLEDLTAEDYRGRDVPYLCNWAFELLRTSRFSLGLDFRQLISRFDAHFDNRTARCVAGSSESCRGDQLESCKRFTGAETQAQSAHTLTCDKKCGRVRWSKVSYTNCYGPRAVHVEEASLDVLNYCRASRSTLAISHVWSHGQGGRPEDGINSCLHQRYCNLARDLGCESYWIDSACIPNDGPLRNEAIGYINQIFAESKVTLVIDSDLQSVDLVSPSINTLETLLSVLLVCDWNVRAWTMLEAIRGSRSIYILGKDDEFVSLRKVLDTVHQKGSIDVAVLLGGAQHLLQPTHSLAAKSIEEGGYLLSQRHASRTGDDVIIWSLLNNVAASKDAANLWIAQSHVRTAFLISSVPRLEGLAGLGWAPGSPYVRAVTRSVKLDVQISQLYIVRYPSYDGQGSFLGQITKRGLLSKWRVMDIESEILAPFRENCLYQIPGAPSGYEHKFLEMNTSISVDTPVYAQPDETEAYLMMSSLLKEDAKIRILRPLAEDGMSPYEGGSHRGGSFGLVAAICVCFGGDSMRQKTEATERIWKWMGVYQWQESSGNERWRVEEMLIG